MAILELLPLSIAELAGRPALLPEELADPASLREEKPPLPLEDRLFRGLAVEAGVSHPTARSWISVLQASYIWSAPGSTPGERWEMQRVRRALLELPDQAMPRPRFPRNAPAPPSLATTGGSSRFSWDRWRPRRHVRRNRRNAGNCLVFCTKAGPSAQCPDDAGETPAHPGKASLGKVQPQQGSRPTPPGSSGLTTP
ncbi:MAG: hypothetical protein ACJ76J_27035 [Thermoanaerobaculia bacterium]